MAPLPPSLSPLLLSLFLLPSFLPLPSPPPSFLPSLPSIFLPPPPPPLTPLYSSLHPSLPSVLCFGPSYPPSLLIPLLPLPPPSQHSLLSLPPSLPPFLPPFLQAQLAQRFNCTGLLIFSDPHDYAPAGVPVYPDGPSLPEYGVQRGSLQLTEGDVLTPGIPALCK